MIIKEKKENFLFSIDNPVGAKVLACLRLQLSLLMNINLDINLNINGFEDTISPM